VLHFVLATFFGKKETPRSNTKRGKRPEKGFGHAGKGLDNFLNKFRKGRGEGARYESQSAGSSPRAVQQEKQKDADLGSKCAGKTQGRS